MNTVPTSSLPDEETPRKRGTVGKFKTLSVSGGGARVISTICGGLLAFEQFGIEFELIVALSGSFGPAASWQYGTRASKLAVRAVETKFISLLHWEKSVPGWLWAIACRRVSERVFPESGIFGTEKVGEYFASLVPCWPRGLATASVTSLFNKRRLILYTDRGIFEQTESGFELLISLEDMVAAGRSQIGEAARATMGIPGFCTPQRLQTPRRDMLVFDGVFSSEGPYLIDPLVHKGMFGYKRPEILVFNVTEEDSGWITNVQDFLYWVICRECYIPSSPPGHKEDLSIITPDVRGFSAVNFWVGEYEKLCALMKGYQATAKVLFDSGEITAAQFESAQSIVSGFRALQKRTWWMKLFGMKKWRVEKIKEYLASHGMYELA